jgi:hypothetical protein
MSNLKHFRAVLEIAVDWSQASTTTFQKALGRWIPRPTYAQIGRLTSVDHWPLDGSWYIDSAFWCTDFPCVANTITLDSRKVFLYDLTVSLILIYILD